MISPYKDLDQYGYRIDDCIIRYSDNLNIDDLIIDRKYINNLTIINGYDNNVTPAFVMSVTINKYDYLNLLKYMDSITVYFSLLKYYLGPIKDNIDHTSSELTDSGMQYTKVATFELKAISDGDIDTWIPNKLHFSAESDKDSDATLDRTQLKMYLYDYSKIQKYRIAKSYIINGGLNDCLYRIFKDRGLSNILCEPIASKYKTYIMEYGHLGQNLSSLNKYYGLYNNPYLFYMDIDRIYMLDKGKLGKTLSKGEIGNVNLYLESETERQTYFTGCYIDDVNNLYALNAGVFTLNNYDDSIYYATGGVIKTVIQSTGEVKTDKLSDDVDVERYFTVYNEKQHSQLMFNIHEKRRNVSLSFSNIDIDIVKPNKLFNIISDHAIYDPELGIDGSYRLSSSTLIFTKSSDTAFKLTTQLTLNKIS